MSNHEYQGGSIISLGGGEVPPHYHVSYTRGPSSKYEEGFEIVVDDKGFSVSDEWEQRIEPQSFPTLEEAVKFCFAEYAKLHPGETVEPIWGAGAPNKALANLGYKRPWENLTEK